MKINENGENFITEQADMANICGAYCLPEYRGRGLYQALLAFVVTRMKTENRRCLGVDYETFNPTARSFGEKFFTPYTFSVTRRIDDYALIC